MRKVTIISLIGVFAMFSVMGWAAEPSSSYNQSQQSMQQNAPSSERPQMQPSTAQGMEKTGAFTPEILRAKTLIGMKVENPKGERLGKIEDIVLTPDRNRIAYGVLSFGGVMGMGDKYFAVPWPALETTKVTASAEPSRERSTRNEYLILNKDKDTLKNAPGFDKDHWPNMASAEWESSVHQYYGTTAEPQTAQSRQTAAANVEERRVSKLLDLKVNNPQNQDIGKIHDIAFDTHKGDVVYGIISLKESMPTTGADMAAVPWNTITIQPDAKVAQLTADKNQLEAVAFKKSEYPNLADREFGRRIYQQFNRQPYWDVLGYTAPGAEPSTERPGMAAMETHPAWAANSDYNKKFNPSEISTLRGTVQSVSSFEPEKGARPGVAVTLKTDDGKTMTVQLGPHAFMSRHDMIPATGDQLTVKGCKADFNGQNVFIASEIQNKGKTLELRSASGAPAWTMKGMMGRSGGKMMRERGTRQQPAQ